MWLVKWDGCVGPSKRQGHYWHSAPTLINHIWILCRFPYDWSQWIGEEDLGCPEDLMELFEREAQDDGFGKELADWNATIVLKEVEGLFNFS